MQRPAIPDILEECLEELSFLASRLRALAFAPDVPHRRLAEHHARGDAWRACLDLHPAETQALAVRWLDAGKPPWLHAAAATAWLTLRRPDAVALAVRIQEQPAETLPDWRQALRTTACDPAWIDEAMRPERPTTLRHLLIDALGWHGQADARLIERAAADADPAIRWSAARHAGTVPGVACLDRLCDDADAGVAAVARYALCLADPGAGQRRAAHLRDGLDAWLLGHHGDDDAVGPLAACARGAGPLAAAAVAALADHGSRAACAALLDLGAVGKPGLAALLGAQPGGLDGWDALAGGGSRVLHGAARPWRGPAAEEPALFRWRAAIAAGSTGALRREIPDGVLGGEPDVTEPGL